MLIGLIVTANAQRQPSLIKGTWKDAPQKEVGIYAIENGELVQLSQSAIASDGSFVLAFYPEKEGFYALAINPLRATYRHMFYFKPGDNLQLEVERDSYKLTGKDNTPENKEMERWHNMIQPLESLCFYSFNNVKSTYNDFFTLLDQKLLEAKNFTAPKTKNKVFNEAMKKYEYYNINDIAIFYFFSPKISFPADSEYPDYYRNIDTKALTASADILSYPRSLMFIDYAYYLSAYFAPSPQNEISMKRLKENNLDFTRIGNDTVRGEYVLSKANNISTYLGIMKYKADNEKYLATDRQRELFTKIVNKYSPKDEGTEPYMFNFTDINGKQVAMADLKGKVVYIDCWTTWCGPCKQEIPYMGKLEEEYADKDIIFVSISIDNEKDKAKWEEMVKEKNMKGYQLFAGNAGHDEICKHYSIRTIPRFILIGKDGKVINSDAPRPSSGEIRLLLDNALSK